MHAGMLGAHVTKTKCERGLAHAQVNLTLLSSEANSLRARSLQRGGAQSRSRPQGCSYGGLPHSLSPPLSLSAPSDLPAPPSASSSATGTQHGGIAARGAMDLVPPPLSLHSDAPTSFLFQTTPAPRPHVPRRSGPREQPRRAGAAAPPVLTNLDSLLNSGYDNGALERAASEQAPEPHLPFHATLGDCDRRAPRLGGPELYSSLLGSLRESIDRRMQGGLLSSRRDSSLALALDSFVSVGGGGRDSGPQAPPLGIDSALARLQLSIESGTFAPCEVLPVHHFLPTVRVRVAPRQIPPSAAS